MKKRQPPIRAHINGDHDMPQETRRALQALIAHVFAKMATGQPLTEAERLQLENAELKLHGLPPPKASSGQASARKIVRECAVALREHIANQGDRCGAFGVRLSHIASGLESALSYMNNEKKRHTP